MLDIIALAVFAGLYGLYRNQDRLGAGTGYAKDPVCGMQVQIAQAAAAGRHEGATYYFCSDHCRHRFTASTGRYRAVSPAAGPEESRHGIGAAAATAADVATDPVCGMAGQ